MLKMMRKEIDTALQNNLPLSAMIAALSLIDGVSKVEYPHVQSQKIRYTNWWANFAETPNDIFNADMVYQLRCAIMHETRMDTPRGSLSAVFLCIPDTAESLVAYNALFDIDGELVYKLDVVAFCVQTCNAFDAYYASHQTQVDIADAQMQVITQEEVNMWLQNPTRWQQDCMQQLNLQVQHQDGLSFIQFNNMNTKEQHG
ncbi:MAG: hypothetical protein IJZ68_05490 [Bacteroidaceae bacterium]|nr:hypothetical protein [Bacteroidaceae bacterium]